MMPTPARRKRLGSDACDCCEAECDCGDCERCAAEPLQAARDWIPPPATGGAKPKKRT